MLILIKYEKMILFTTTTTTAIISFLPNFLRKFSAVSTIVEPHTHAQSMFWVFLNVNKAIQYVLSAAAAEG